jgi:hypothetical protein
MPGHGPTLVFLGGVKGLQGPRRSAREYYTYVRGDANRRPGDGEVEREERVGLEVQAVLDSLESP